MITVTRGLEPDELRRARGVRLREAVAAFNVHGPGSAELYRCLERGYDVAKPELFRRQYRKCAYCESLTPLDETPTEHFRPKKKAQRNWRKGEERSEDEMRYWWLTWTWENLLFSCTTCNGQSHKGNHFPLVKGTEPLAAPARPATLPLPAHHFDVTAEHALLIDPADATIDPLDHMRWRPLEPGLPPALWSFGIRGITSSGRATVNILKLDERAPDVNTAYYETVWPRFRREVHNKLKRSRLQDVSAAWLALVHDLVHPRAEFAAARWCMLEALRTMLPAVSKLQLPEAPRPRPPGP